jgi:hypothetical protein
VVRVKACESEIQGADNHAGRVIRMVARKAIAKAKTPAGPTTLQLDQKKGETGRQVVARAMVGPFTRHGVLAAQLHDKMTGALPDDQKPGMVEFSWEIKGRTEKAVTGDLNLTSELLISQALSLDGIFTELARRSALNMGDHLDASERYMRLALKAQANSRATLEALAKLHQPREQTVRHVHVNEGGQAVIANQFHHHAGGLENGQTADQPHAQSPRGPAMLGHDAHGNGVPIPSDQGAEPVPDARREGKRRAQGQ